MKCYKNGIKREGESCTLNDNCIYPECIELQIDPVELLEWIIKEGYVFNKDKNWYKKGSYRPWNPTEYFTSEQLTKLFKL